MVLVVLALALASSAPPGGDKEPAPIPGAQLMRAADLAYGELRRIGDLAGSDPAPDDVGLRLWRVERELEQLRAAGFTGGPGQAFSGDLDYFHDELTRREAEVRRWDDRLAERAGQLDAAAASLRRLVATWRLTIESLEADAPPALAARAIEVRDRASALEQVVRKRMTSVLELQDRVLALKLRLADLVAGLRSARTQGLLEIESKPLWRAFAPERPAFGPAIRPLRLHALTCLRYVQAEPVRSILHLLLIAALAAAGVALGRTGRDVAEAGSPAEVVVVRHPVQAAILLGLTVTPLVHPDAPPALTLVLFLAGVAPFLRIAQSLGPGWKGPLRWLVALYALERLAAMVPGLGAFERVVLLAVEAVAFAGCLIGLRRGGWLRRLPSGRWKMLAAAAAGVVAAVLLAIAIVANVLGNVTLSEFLAHATLASACGAAIIVTCAFVLGGGLRAGLRLAPGGESRLLRGYGQVLIGRAAPLFRIVAVLVSCWWTLRAFRSTQSFGAVAASALGIRLKVGALDVTLGDVVAFAITLWIAVWLSRALKFALDEAVLPSLQVTRGRAAAISTSVKYLVVAIGFSFAMLAAGMEMTRFAVLAGTLGVGIGFGLQNVVNNFVCGLILLYEQPVQVGDVIEIGQLTGEVQRIGVRSSTVRTFQGADVIVPNSNFISAEVVNWTRSDRIRRVDVKVGVAYGSDPPKVEELLLATAQAFPGVAATPAPVALLTAFGDNALQFELRFWTAIDTWVTTASGLRAAIDEALRRAGIAIPFPQLDLWVRSAPPAPGKRESATRPTVLAGPEKSPRP